MTALVILLLLSGCVNALNTTHPSCFPKEPIEVYNAFTGKNIHLKVQSALQDYQPCRAEHEDPNCSCYASNIVFDLEPFSKMGITEDFITARSKYGTPYKIYRGRLYRQRYCEFEDRCIGVEYFLLRLAYKLPNLDFVLRVHEWPEVHILSGLCGPVFSYTKTKYFLDILYPTWSFWQPRRSGLITQHDYFGRWDQIRDRISKVASNLTWSKKLSIGFYRGARYSVESDALVLLSRRSPSLVNAAYTAYPYQKMPLDMFGSAPNENISFEYHCQYKYLFNFRDIGASFRFRHLFLCKSLVFHVGDEWQEFFYSQLKPWMHYVPVNSNADQEEYEQLLNFFRENDELAKRISERGYEFIWRHLRMEDIESYWENLLKNYAGLLKYVVKPNAEFIEITSNGIHKYNKTFQYKNELSNKCKQTIDKTTSKCTSIQVYFNITY